MPQFICRALLSFFSIHDRRFRCLKDSFLIFFAVAMHFLITTFFIPTTRQNLLNAASLLVLATIDIPARIMIMIIPPAWIALAFWIVSNLPPLVLGTGWVVDVSPYFVPVTWARTIIRYCRQPWRLRIYTAKLRCIAISMHPVSGSLTLMWTP